MMSYPDVPLYILAGGQSRRFGSDKARARLDGQTLIEGVALRLGGAAVAVTAVAAEANAYSDLGIRTIADGRPGRGPMEGLLAALKDCRGRFGAGWIMVAACDLADPSPAWGDHLASHIRPGLDAVVPWCNRWEPLLALYHTRLIDRLRQQLAAGQRSMQALIWASRVAAVPPVTLGEAVTQINTRAEHAAFAEAQNAISH